MKEIGKPVKDIKYIREMVQTIMEEESRQW